MKCEWTKAINESTGGGGYVGEGQYSRVWYAHLHLLCA